MVTFANTVVIPPSALATAQGQNGVDREHRGSTSKGSPGSGIGLAFSRRVVQRHGGTLEVDDAPGGGARFTVRLPLPSSED